MGLKQVSFVQKASYLRGSLKSHYINYEFSLLSGCEYFMTVAAGIT